MCDLSFFQLPFCSVQLDCVTLGRRQRCTVDCSLYRSTTWDSQIIKPWMTPRMVQKLGIPRIGKWLTWSSASIKPLTIISAYSMCFIAAWFKNTSPAYSSFVFEWNFRANNQCYILKVCFCSFKFTSFIPNICYKQVLSSDTSQQSASWNSWLWKETNWKTVVLYSYRWDVTVRQL